VPAIAIRPGPLAAGVQPSPGMTIPLKSCCKLPPPEVTKPVFGSDRHSLRRIVILGVKDGHVTPQAVIRLNDAVAQPRFDTQFRCSFQES
jgi:hypothetical protein